MMKKIAVILLICALLLCSCGQTNAPASDVTTVPSDTTTENSGTIDDTPFSDFDRNTSEGENPTKVEFGDWNAVITGDGVFFENGILTVAREGTYILSGHFYGNIVVNADKEDDVHLIFDGLTMECAAGAAINGISSDKIVITLKEGTENSLSDGADYFVNKGDEPNACIFSDDDLTVNGEGKLTVTGNCNNGIGSKNDLRIVSGEIEVSAPKNALKGNDSVVIGGGKIALDAGKDGIKSDNEKDPERGFVTVNGGDITITAGDDGIQAVTYVDITGGKINTVGVADKPVNCDGEVNIREGCM